jgi:hypothetical protein
MSVSVLRVVSARHVPGLRAVVVANGARCSVADENGREIG